jgi:hypothetical protein
MIGKFKPVTLGQNHTAGNKSLDRMPQRIVCAADVAWPPRPISSKARSRQPICWGRCAGAAALDGIPV